jgi:hypothetical protein
LVKNVSINDRVLRLSSRTVKQIGLDHLKRLQSACIGLPTA